jgi:septal ring factor EnvC (AmiA/AmiB activator)
LNFIPPSQTVNAAILLLGLVLISGNLAAEQITSESEVKDHLQELQTNIYQLEVWLEEANEQQSTLTRQLRQSEMRVDHLLKQIAIHKGSLTEIQTRQQTLALQHKQLQSSQDEQQHHLNIQLQASYKQGATQATQLLLSLDQTASIGRTLKYYQYINHSRVKKLKSYRQTLQDLVEVQQQQNKTKITLQQEQQALQRQQQELKLTRQQQQQALQRLNQDISSHNQRLTIAKQDRQRFQSLLQKLQANLAKHTLLGKYKPFGQQKGKLHWPLKGKVLNQFGRQQKAYPLSRDGWLIQTNNGDQVKSIYAGRVVFANWLKGYGLMLIIDHGSEYLSLYGHNQALYRMVGEQVKPGDLLASSGNSGGNSMTALYFSIRHKSQPLHPGKWLR